MYVASCGDPFWRSSYLPAVLLPRCHYSDALEEAGVTIANAGSPDRNEAQMIAAIVAGDWELYHSLIQPYELSVYRMAMSFVKDETEAEDVAQEAFLKAFHNLATFRGQSKFSTWLYTVVRTSCITFLRKKKLATTSMDNERTLIQLENRESGFNANTIEQKSKYAMVNAAIRLLSPDDAQLITLFYKGEQTLGEIGLIMGLDPNTVKVKLHRARHRLKDKMEKHFSYEVQELQGE